MRLLLRTIAIVLGLSVILFVLLIAATIVGAVLEMRRMEAGDYPLADSSEVVIDGRIIRIDRYSTHPLLAEYKRVVTVRGPSGEERVSELELDSGGGGRLSLCKTATGELVMSDHIFSYRILDDGAVTRLSGETILELKPDGSATPLALPEKRPECAEQLGAFDRGEDDEYGFQLHR